MYLHYFVSTNQFSKKGLVSKRLELFGSFARGEEHSDSDIDILVTFRKEEKTFEHYMDCKFYLEELFGRDVDLVLKNTLKNRLKSGILAETVYA